MNTLFYGFVELQRWIVSITGMTYEEVNVWGYCIIGPIIFYLLYILLTILLGYKAIKVNNTIGKVMSTAFLICGLYVAFAFPSIRDMLNNIHSFYTNCDEYIYSLAGHSMKDYLDPQVQADYIVANVWVFIILGPLPFIILAGASTINVCTLTEKIKSWQLNTGIGILFISAIAMLYGINILKTLLY